MRLTLAALAATVWLGAGASAEPVKIRLSWVAPIANIGSIIMEKKDLALHMGKSYVLEPVRYQGTPPMITALANNELEIADLAYSTLPIAIQNAGLDDLRVISDEFQDGVEGYYSNEFFVLKDGPIQKVGDLKGKVVATNAAGSAVDIASRAMLRKHGLEDKRDYTVIEAPFPTMKAVLLDGKADMIVSTTPFVFDPELQAKARVLFTQRDAMGTSELSFWTAREGFIGKNRAAMVDLLEDSLRAVRWYLDPANRTEAIDILARFLKQPPARFESWIFTRNDFYRNPDGLVNLDALQSNIDLMRKLGIINADLDARKHANLELVGEATQRLK
jgi:NitT/TauT family transport system substrate-binding protein